jgi:hypothetical protein
MPNGGVPLHMILRPRDGSPIVLHAEGAKLAIHSADLWDRDKTNAAPLAVISEAEAFVLSRFLRYWLADTESGVVGGGTGLVIDFDY